MLAPIAWVFGGQTVSVRTNLSRKLIQSHLVEGEMRPGSEVALQIDQTLTQDATGTLVMLELEAMGLDRVRTELRVGHKHTNWSPARDDFLDDPLINGSVEVNGT